MEAFSAILPIFIFVLIVPLIVYLTLRRQRVIKEKMREIARILGLQYSDGSSPFPQSQSSPAQPGQQKSGAALAPGGFLSNFIGSLTPWRLSGNFKSLPVEIYSITRGSGKSSQIYTVIKAIFSPPLTAGLQISTEGFFNRIGKSLFSTQDIQTGDETFDKRVMIKGNSEPVVKSLLSSPALRQTILKAFDTLNDLSIDDTGAVFEERGVNPDAERYRSILELLTSISGSFPGSGRF